MTDEIPRWEHAGGKLAELGPESLSDAELLSILIAPGTPGNPAEEMARNILERFGSIEALGGQPLERLYDVKGMGDAKIIRLAAALEIARRAAYGILDVKRPQTIAR